jgi:hypothetical protein
MKLRCLILIIAALLPGVTALAHPVAQGAMEITARRDRVTVRARVSVEEALVAEGFSKTEPAGGIEAIWPRHASYLLQHLHVEADGAPLSGRVLRVTPPPNTVPESRIICELEFPLEVPPQRLAFGQDVLNEFEFAPGNPWEATFVTTLGQEGRRAQSGLLFTRKELLALECDWNSPETPGAARLDHARMFGEYLWHGVHHILVGYDHLLFMAGLVLAVTSILDLIKVVTAFTLAHTVTLTLSVLNIVRLPSHIVEPMIAASIVFVALQNIVAPAQSRGWTRLAVAFGFGLFHGLGFAGGLLAAMEGMPGVAIATAIIAFSIGVELGHQVVVIPLFAALTPSRRKAAATHALRPMPIVRFGSAAVCLAGVFYLFAALR